MHPMSGSLPEVLSRIQLIASLSIRAEQPFRFRRLDVHISSRRPGGEQSAD
jgi:hypothetical protein